MVVIARKGRVPAPIEEVWAVVRSAEALPAWLAGLRRVRVEGPEGFGRRLWLTGLRTGDGADRPAEIIAWKPPTLLAWRCAGERPDELHVQLTPWRQGTQVHLFAVRRAGPLGCLRLRTELGRSVTALRTFLAAPPARPSRPPLPAPDDHEVMSTTRRCECS